MKKRNELLLAAALSMVLGAFSRVASAQVDATPDQNQFTKELINESVNTTTLFASQDILSTGEFAKRSSGQPDTRYKTIRTPFEVALSDKKGRWVPYVYGSGALLKVTSGAAMPPGAEGEDDFSTLDLFALASGVGTYLKVSDDFKLSTSFSLTYSHLSNHYDFNNTYSQAVLEPQSNLYYNFSLDLFTYAPTARAIYEHSWGERIANYTLGYSQLFNNSFSSSSPDVDINSSTGFLWNRVSYTEPVGWEVLNTKTGLRPFFQWSNISGKAAQGLSLSNLFEVGADVVFNFTEKFCYLSQLYWGASYVTGDSFEGYHLGLGGKF